MEPSHRRVSEPVRRILTEARERFRAAGKKTPQHFQLQDFRYFLQPLRQVILVLSRAMEDPQPLGILTEETELPRAGVSLRTEEPLRTGDRPAVRRLGFGASLRW